MRKIAFVLLILVGVFGCSENNDAQQVCTNKLWSLDRTCSPPNSTNCVYFATFGETQQDAGTIQIEQVTYDYYLEKGNTSNGSICWDGPQN